MQLQLAPVELTILLWKRHTWEFNCTCLNVTDQQNGKRRVTFELKRLFIRDIVLEIFQVEKLITESILILNLREFNYLA